MDEETMDYAMGAVVVRGRPRKPQGEKLYHVVVYLTADQMIAVDRLAAMDDRNRSEWIRRAVVAAITAAGPLPPDPAGATERAAKENSGEIS